MAILIEQLTDSDRGRGVVYRAHGSPKDGVISSWNDTYIFVRYHGSETSKATRPADLEFLCPVSE